MHGPILVPKCLAEIHKLSSPDSPASLLFAQEITMTDAVVVIRLRNGASPMLHSNKNEDHSHLTCIVSGLVGLANKTR